MNSDDLTVKILQEIRDEVRATNVRLDSTNVRLDSTNVRLDDLNRRVVESEVRTATAIADLAGTVREMTGVLRAQHDLRPRMDRCEQEIAELKRKLA